MSNTVLSSSDRDIRLARDSGFQTWAVAWSRDVRRRTVACIDIHLCPAGERGCNRVAVRDEPDYLM